jgi:DNA-directed RNA polymerase I, II, and III subunit RPABC1
VESDNRYKMDEVLKTMLAQRGVPVETLEELEDPSGGRLQKVGEYLIHTSPKSRLSEDDIESFAKDIGDKGAARGILLVDNPPSASVLNVIRKHSDMIQLFHKRQLAIDTSAHRKVSPHRILTMEERTAFFERYRVKPEYMPAIDSQDPMAKWVGARPGDILEILRKSEAAGGPPYYRICVANTSLA